MLSLPVGPDVEANVVVTYSGSVPVGTSTNHPEGAVGVFVVKL